MKTILYGLLICGMMVVVGCASQAKKEPPKVGTVPSVPEAKKAEPTKTADGQLIQYVDTPSGRWRVHDEDRPAPKVITPGTCSTQTEVGTAPSDAIVLFDGKDLSHWQHANGQPAKWTLGDGYMETVKGAGMLQSKETFGSCQLHVEFATPSTVSGSSQGRGNSGVFLMGKYEIQILDSFNNDTYPDGQASAVYGQQPPLVNASRGPGQWQSYDIIFHRPIFKDGKVERPATVTILHNGVLVHDNYAIQGSTFHGRRAEYEPHGDKGPLQLQDHGNPVHFRNVWVRELED